MIERCFACKDWLRHAPRAGRRAAWKGRTVHQFQPCGNHGALCRLPRAKGGRSCPAISMKSKLIRRGYHASQYQGVVTTCAPLAVIHQLREEGGL